MMSRDHRGGTAAARRPVTRSLAQSPSGTVTGTLLVPRSRVMRLSGLPGAGLGPGPASVPALTSTGRAGRPAPAGLSASQRRGHPSRSGRSVTGSLSRRSSSTVLCRSRCRPWSPGSRGGSGGGLCISLSPLRGMDRSQLGKTTASVSSYYIIIEALGWPSAGPRLDFNLVCEGSAGAVLRDSRNPTFGVNWGNVGYQIKGT